MTDRTKEKVLILGALFHDIGKFEQRCTGKRETHQSLGAFFIETLKNEIMPILQNSEQDFEKLKRIILNHHNANADDKETLVVRYADHLSAGERVGFDTNEEPGEKWQHKYLASVVSKLRINNPQDAKSYLRYYRHKPLSKDYFDFMIPEFASEDDAKGSGYSYLKSPEIFVEFRENIRAAFSIYKKETDFEGLVNLLLLILEKYTWCLPDFTGSEETDISLFNHLKDVTGFAHALHLAEGEDNDEKELVLIVGDLPGIQNYIFDIANKKPAKILRGRSIFVQVLTRIFASIYLKSFGLTEANLVMLAGGKFYIIAPADSSFNDKYIKTRKQIEKLLEENFNFNLNFAVGCHRFKASDLKEKGSDLTFGDIIEMASYDLLNRRHQSFSSNFFGNFDQGKFVLAGDYIDDLNSDNIKCDVTEKPIKKGRKSEIPAEDLKKIDKQVKIEYDIGNFITKGTIGILLDENLNRIVEIKLLDKLENYYEGCTSIILNPVVEELLTIKEKSSILLNSSFITVANFCTLDKNGKAVMDFETMEDGSEGAKLLTLIKGDIDNLGLIMSCGLMGDEKDLTAVSRTTTLSHHLKYFFSFFINGYLEKQSGSPGDSLFYTIFAGGDDLMLVTTHSNSLKLLKALNDKFNEFCCENQEMHISWSLTNFKHGTPIRIVADFADENQEMIKKKFAPDSDAIDPESYDYYFPDKNKAGANIYDSPVKNSKLELLLELQEKLYRWTEREKPEDKPVLSQGVIRNLLLSARYMNDFRIKGETSKLLWHPVLVHLVKRELQKRNGEYKNPEIKEFIEGVLSIAKDTEEKRELEQILVPLLCSTIYLNRNRKSKSEKES